MGLVKKIKFIDLFCGIGGIRIGLENALKECGMIGECLLSAEIKKHAKITYSINFKEENFINVTEINEKDIPDFDILLAGFPCQAFSTAGKRMGFEDTRGTLFFDVARIIKEKKPNCFILENVEGLVGHDNGKTLDIILKTIKELGYHVNYKLLDSANYGIAQSRKRIYIVGSLIDSLNNIFDFKIKNVVFKEIREYNKELVLNDNFNRSLKKNKINPLSLSGKALRDKRGGVNNIHSWDLGLRGAVTEQQQKLLEIISVERRMKRWSDENKAHWFDGMPININQIKEKIDYPKIEQDLLDLVKIGYIKYEHPKDIKIINGKKEKILRLDLLKGYDIISGKLSFDFSNFLDDEKPTPTIVATDAKKLGVIESNGIRKLTRNEIKKLFGFPLDYKTDHLKESEFYDLFGNSVTINVIENIAKNLIKVNF